MKLTVVGLGYVGLTAAGCLADAGNTVWAVDSNHDKIAALNKGVIPFYEPGLGDIVSRNLKNRRIEFSCDLNQAILNSDVVFIAVGTPGDEKGIVNLSQINAVAASISASLYGYKLIVIKSTVPPGSCSKIKSKIATRTKNDFDCISNPEFLRQGSAVNDFLYPARIVIGADDPKAEKIMRQLYRPFTGQETKMIVMAPASAELAKYAANAMLAARISFMNELSILCEKTGADINHLRRAIGCDPRIGEEFLSAGIGYGGSCLPKDVAALINIGSRFGCQMKMARSIQQININQQKRFIQKILKRFQGNKAKVAVWGLAFKAGTDDIRESPAIYCIEQLLKKGFKVTAYDPLAAAKMCKSFGRQIKIVNEKYDALDGADALVIFTDCPEFEKADLESVSRKIKVIFDGRNLFDPAYLAQLGIEYHCIGRNFSENSKK